MASQQTTASTGGKSDRRVLKNTKIGVKITGSSLALVALLIIVAVTSYIGLRQIVASEAVVEKRTEDLTAVSETHTKIVRQYVQQANLVMEQSLAHYDDFDAAAESATQSIEAIRSLMDSDEELRWFDDIQQAEAEFIQLFENEVVPAVESGDYALAASLSNQSEELLADINATMQLVSASFLREARDAQATASRAEDRTLALVTGTTVGAIIISLVLGALISRSIAGPLAEMTRVASGLAGGETDQAISITGDDEIGHMADAFRQSVRYLQKTTQAAERLAARDLTVNFSPESERDVLGKALADMVASLRDQLQDIAGGAAVLSAAANQISVSVAQLASTTSETATSVSETTTTMAEVKQTAYVADQKAEAVSRSAQQAAQVSQDGRRATEQTITGMNRIRQQMSAIAESIVRLSEQSEAIGSIIATVTDLADQSNLLAVNAAIEAAKAGDQGRGFAVVAQEVRSLAEQSKQATNRVRAILGDIQKATGSAVMATEQGTKAVDAGVERSTEAGKAIAALSESVREAAHSASQITASSQQQLAGIDQVAIAMESIDQASAQNVDSTRQLDAAAQSLQDLSRRLQELVAPYRL